MSLNFCPYCGSKLVDQTKFCTNCGEKIIKENYNNLDEKEVKKYSNIQTGDTINTRSKRVSDKTRGDKIFTFLVMFIFGTMFFVMLYYSILDYQAKYKTNDIDTSTKTELSQEQKSKIEDDNRQNRKSDKSYINNDLNLFTELNGVYSGTLQSVDISGHIIFTTFRVSISNNHISYKSITDRNNDVTVQTGTFTFTKLNSNNYGVLNAVFANGDTEKFHYYQDDSGEYYLKIKDFLCLAAYQQWIKMDIKLVKI